MPKAIYLTEPGGPEKLVLKDMPAVAPGIGEVLMRQTAAGLNFIDIYHRTGVYALPGYPAILGMEGAGIVEKCGPGADMFQPGDRVAYGIGPVGGYAQMRVIPQMKLVRLPDAIDDKTAASVMLKGLTAHFLLRRTFMAGPGHTILVHAAAGGVGLLLCQWAKALGARVIGTAGSEEKARLALENGCDFAILHTQENVVRRVKDITGGQGVNAVYDAVGKDTYQISLDCLMRFGIFISYGQASGPLPPIDSQELARRGSLFFTRPSLMHYKENRQEYVMSALELFDMMGKGLLKARTGREWPLAEAPQAHRELQAGKTTGSTILVM